MDGQSVTLCSFAQGHCGRIAGVQPRSFHKEFGVLIVSLPDALSVFCVNALNIC